MRKSIVLILFISIFLLVAQLYSTDGYPYRLYFNSGHDSVLYYGSVINGADSTLVAIGENDTIPSASFPYDTIMILNADSAYSFLILWYINDQATATIIDIPRRIDTLIDNTELAADTSTGGPWASTDDIVTGILEITVPDTLSNTLFSFWTRYMNEIKSDIDTSLILGGYTPNAFSYQYRSANIDTLVLGIGTDTLIDIIYYHDGGTPGAAPDSTRVQVHP